MENNAQIQVFKARLDQKISQLAREYSGELVFKIWEEIKSVGGDRAYFSLCGWKPKMTLTEALECLDDYCDFIEAMLWKHLEKKRGSRYLPALFN